ncbi:AAA family ATPase [Nonomuraea sp. NPDC050536]|uniref:P-loop NTPase n=1 Tax=Nonomuraea sp. NPDC050536 TaxID=3364366 RepID=UPI0037C8FA3C
MRLGERLDTARRRGFVGRESELAAFERLLDPSLPAQVLLVHGPGGVGKTALLHQYGWRAAAEGHRVIWLDGHEIEPTQAAVLAALGIASLDELSTMPGLVLLIDTLELLAPLERWLRRELIPALAGDALAVLAGRDRPPPVWRADPGWRELVDIVQLGNLSHPEGRRLLELRGVPEADQNPALDFTRGHPLALALVADVAAQRRFSAVSAHQVMGALLKSFVDTVPSPLHQQALEACAQVLATTEPLLAALLDLRDAAELFAWLRDLSIVEYGSRGLFPHDLARDALGAELRWRDPDGCEEIRRRAAAYYRQQFGVARPAVQQLILLDFVYLHRDTSVLGPFVAGYPQTGALSAHPALPAELGTFVSWVRKHEGEESARICSSWLERQPGSAVAIRSSEGATVGFYQLISVDATLDASMDASVDDDPAMARVPARGQMVRFWMDGERYQEPSPVQLFITVQLFRSYLQAACPDHTLLTFASAEPFAEGCAHVDFHRMPEADFTVGGHVYAVFGHDWTAVPPLAWVSRLAERDSLISSPTSLLDEETFAAAVKSALRSLGRAGGLRDSPLLASMLARGQESALRAVLKQAADQLAASPRDRRLHRALHHTFVQPAETQAAAAELLGLPMTTYRRHLAAAEARLTEILWQHELDARGP